MGEGARHEPGSASRRLLARLAVPISLIAWAGCTSAVSPSPERAGARETSPAASRPVPLPSAALSGFVYDASGAPVPGALVTVVPPTRIRAGELMATRVRASSDGSYRFDALPPAKYALTAAAPGHAAALGGLIDVGEGPARGDVRLGRSEGFVISGAVRDTAGAPLADVEVVALELSQRPGAVFTTVSGADGRYSIELAPGVPYIMGAAALRRPHAFRRLDEGQTSADLVLLDAVRPRPSDEVIAGWLRASAAPLDAVAPGAPRADLAGLRAAIGKARVVGLGEAAHGGSEFASLKHRILEMLAEEGPVVLALEAGFGECVALDDWVTTGKGDPVAALGWVMTWPLETEEFLALLRWMRRQNEGPRRADKLRVHGFDVTTWGSKTALLEFLGKVDASARAEASAALEPLGSPEGDGAYLGATPERKEATRASLARVAAAFAIERTRYAARTSAAATERAAQHLDALRAAERSLSGATSRDRAMAENLLALAARQPPGRRVAVWAHNAHVTHQPGRVEDMGLRLREALGVDYVTVGFAFGEGSVRAIDPSKGFEPAPVELRGPQGLDAALGLYPGAAPAYAIDLRTARGATADWLSSFAEAWSIGAVLEGPDAATQPVVPARAYDALVYVRRVTPSRPLPRVTKGKAPEGKGKATK